MMMLLFSLKQIETLRLITEEKKKLINFYLDTTTNTIEVKNEDWKKPRLKTKFVIYL